MVGQRSYELPDPDQPPLQRLMTAKLAYDQFIGQKFGRLTITEYLGIRIGGGKTKAKTPIMLCRCDCGATKEVRYFNLQSGNTVSCGCAHKDAVTTHGLTKTFEYGIWEGIVQRCTNPNSKYYEYYGGRGIRICEKWRNSFEDFLKDMGKRPSTRHSIDRIDNSGNYEPNNCKWITMHEQARNKRSNILVTRIDRGGKEEVKILADWAKIKGIEANTVRTRIKRYNWPLDRALEATDGENFFYKEQTK